MQKHPYDLIATDENARSEFFHLCEKRIKLLKSHGFIAEAVIHAKALRDIRDDLDAIAMY